MAAEMGMVAEYLVPLNAEEEQRIEKITQNFIYISLHDHPTILLVNLKDILNFVREDMSKCLMNPLLILIWTMFLII